MTRQILAMSSTIIPGEVGALLNSRDHRTPVRDRKSKLCMVSVL